MIELIRSIARECAEKLITVERYEPYDDEDEDNLNWWVAIGQTSTSSGSLHIYNNKSDAEYDCYLYRNNAVPIIADSIQRMIESIVTSGPEAEAYVRGMQYGGEINSREQRKADLELIVKLPHGISAIKVYAILESAPLVTNPS